MGVGLILNFIFIILFSFLIAVIPVKEPKLSLSMTNYLKERSGLNTRETKALFAQPALAPKAFQRLPPSSSFG